MAVRLLGCHAFTDAPNTSVVLCSRGKKIQVMEGKQQVEEEEGEEGAEEDAMTARGFPQRWIKQNKQKKRERNQIWK